MTDEKVVLATGVSSGIGAATVSALAQTGYRLLGLVRSPDAPVPAGIERDVRDEASIAAGMASVLSGARSNRRAREQRRQCIAWKG